MIKQITACLVLIISGFIYSMQEIANVTPKKPCPIITVSSDDKTVYCSKTFYTELVQESPNLQNNYEPITKFYDEEVVDKEKIHMIDCHNTNLITPTMFNAFVNARKLFLGNNYFSTMDCLESLKQLTHISLCNNNITTVPENLSTLPALKYLDLRKNSIDCTQAFSKGFVALTRLFLDDNIIDDIKPLHPIIKKIKDIEIGPKSKQTGTKIQKLQLKELSINNNPLSLTSVTSTVNLIMEIFNGQQPLLTKEFLSLQIYLMGFARNRKNEILKEALEEQKEIAEMLENYQAKHLLISDLSKEVMKNLIEKQANQELTLKQSLEKEVQATEEHLNTLKNMENDL